MKLDQLTFTRYLAALSVVIFHYGSTVYPANIPFLTPVLAAGPTAVSYFYALSGFIMAVAYYSVQADAAQFDKTRYWLARIARLYPVYVVALFIVVGAKLHETNLTTVALSATMLQAWIPSYPLTLNTFGWSISVEFFFYLCFPFLLLLVQRISLTQLALIVSAVWLFTQSLHIYLLNTPNYQPFNTLHDIIYYNPVFHLSTFLLGLWVGIAIKQKKLTFFSKKYINIIGLIIVTTLIIFLLAKRYFLMGTFDFKFDYSNGLIAPLFLLFIILLALNTGRIARIMRLPFLVLLGEASYSLYILQKPIHGIYEKLAPAWILSDHTLNFYLFIIVLTITSILSYQFFETPLRRLINSMRSSSANGGEIK